MFRHPFARRGILAGALTALLLAATSAIGASGVVRADGPDASTLYLQSISYGGTGCPQGSVGSSFANDRQSFTMIFDSFVASSGPGVPVTEGRKNCQINLNIHVPAGMALVSSSLTYRGYVQLPAGVSAEAKAIYYFADSPLADVPAMTFAGPVARDYVKQDVVSANVGLSCVERIVSININAQVRLIGSPSAQAQITNDSIDGRVTGVSQPCQPTKDDCKKGGWQNFVAAPGPFKNQGDCVSYFATGGKNPGNGN